MESKRNKCIRRSFIKHIYIYLCLIQLRHIQCDNASSQVASTPSLSIISGPIAARPMFLAARPPPYVKTTCHRLPTTAASVLTPTPPLPTGKTFVVKMSMTLPMTLAQFNATTQLIFRRQMAAVAGLSAETGWTQVNITVQSVRRRRLLEGGIAVAVAITMPDAAAAAAAATALNTDRVNAALAAIGLPAAQITSAAKVTETGGESQPPPSLFSAAPPARAPARAPARLLLLVLLLAAAAAADWQMAP